jgi:hypothetical protein
VWVEIPGETDGPWEVAMGLTEFGMSKTTGPFCVDSKNLVGKKEMIRENGKELNGLGGVV